MARILIVDDVEDLRFLLRRVLENESWEVEEAANAAEALKKVKSFQPALVLLDLMLPDDSGFNVLKKMQEDDETARIPVILLTGVYKDAKAVDKGFGLGAVEYMLKPVRPPELVAKIKLLLRTMALQKTMAAMIKKLTSSERHWRLLFEDALELIVQFDGAGRIVGANPRVVERLGLSVKELTGMSLAGLMDEDRRAAFAEVLAKLEAGEPVEAFTARLLPKEGEPLDVEGNFFPKNPEDGEPTHRAFLRDVTARKKAEDRLRRVQKMEMLSTFAGGVCHDLNGVLTAMRLNIELVEDALREGGIERKCAEDVQAIHASIDHGEDLTRQILLLGKQHEPSPEPLDPARTVAQVGRLIGRGLPKSVTFEVDPGAEGALISADPIQFRQVLVNLCHNGADAMRDGGTLSLRCVAPDADGAATVTVADTGSGMEPKILERIFEPFFTTKGNGTGIGLALVKQIVTQHHGTLHVESEPGKGTTFRLSFPLQKKE